MLCRDTTPGRHVRRLNDKVAEGEAEVECLEYGVGHDCGGQRRVGNAGREYWTDDGETTHQVCPNLT